jgi:hypothetical protein
MNTTTSTPPVKETIGALGDLIIQGARFGLDVFEVMSSGFDALSHNFDALSNSRAAGMMGQMMRSVAPQLARANSCSCHIPQPCWMPRSLGDVTCHVCPGGKATLRIRVTNCGISRNEIRIAVASNEIKVEPPSLTLSPMERGTFNLSVELPAAANTGEEREALIWVVGCMNHYLRWTVKVAKRGADCCHEVSVDDCPDYIHHWYDHFYCLRPCQPRLQLPTRDQG